MPPEASSSDLRCASCDYALDRLEGDAVCPECSFAVTRSRTLLPALTRDALIQTRRVALLLLAAECAWLSVVAIAVMDLSRTVPPLQSGAVLIHLTLLGAAGIALAPYLVCSARRREFGRAPASLGIALIVTSVAAPSLGVILLGSPMPIEALFESRIISISRAFTLSVCLLWLAERSSELRDGTAVAMRVAAVGHAILPMLCVVVWDDSAFALIALGCGLEGLALMLGLTALAGFSITLQRRLAELDAPELESGGDGRSAEGRGAKGSTSDQGDARTPRE